MNRAVEPTSESRKLCDLPYCGNQLVASEQVEAVTPRNYRC